MTTIKSGYANGSDMLLYVGGKPVGHCTSHSVTINSETKDRAVKPVASQSLSAGFWKDKSVIGLNVSISAEGLVFYNETEGGYRSALAQIGKGQSVDVKCMERESTTPYLTGRFVITSLERSDAAQDDATYSISLENDGEVTFAPTALSEYPEPSEIPGA